MAEINPFEVLNDDFQGETGDLDLTNSFTVRPIKSQEIGLDETMEMVKIHLGDKRNFTNAQLDLCAEVVMTQLPEHEREWLREIATSNNYPVWLALLAQFRRCNEYGEAAALIVDPDWQVKAEEK